MALKRKKKEGGGANWMDTYGDMVTLLLCFFVLLYSMSSISEENWKALVMSFNPSAVLAQHETPEGGDGPSADGDGAGVLPEELQAAVDRDMEEVYESILAIAAQAEAGGTISVSKEGGRVFISFSDAVFFAGNSAVLLPEAKPILDQVSAALSEAAESVDEVQVLGHTAQELPDQANNPNADRTLSSQRATNVVLYVQEHSELDPARLVSVGVGQWRPVASNDTPEERAKNRRVEMIISGRNIEEEMSGEVNSYYTTDN